MLEIIGIGIIVGTFIFHLLASIPFIGLWGDFGSFTLWVSGTAFLLYPLGIFLVGYGMTRNFLASLLAVGVAVFLLILLGVWGVIT